MFFCFIVPCPGPGPALVPTATFLIKHTWHKHKGIIVTLGPILQPEWGSMKQYSMDSEIVNRNIWGVWHLVVDIENYNLLILMLLFQLTQKCDKLIKVYLWFLTPGELEFKLSPLGL